MGEAGQHHHEHPAPRQDRTDALPDIRDRSCSAKTPERHSLAKVLADHHRLLRVGVFPAPPSSEGDDNTVVAYVASGM
jgi:hypothetical protein